MVEAWPPRDSASLTSLMRRWWRNSVLVLAAVASCGAQQSGTAQGTSATTPKADETVVVTGTFEPMPLDELQRSVMSLDTQQAPLLYSSDVDYLRLDPSIDLQERAPGGVQADLSIRGSTFGQTLVLIDGLRVNDAQTGHHNLDLPIPLDSISRIEVLHGAGSTFYGADAMGGAVNFITAPSCNERIPAARWAGKLWLQRRARGGLIRDKALERATDGRPQFLDGLHAGPRLPQRGSFERNAFHYRRGRNDDPARDGGPSVRRQPVLRPLRFVGEERKGGLRRLRKTSAGRRSSISDTAGTRMSSCSYGRIRACTRTIT